MKPFHGKVAIVTGGGAGIGQSIGETLAKQGATVIVADINEANARKVADGLRKDGLTSHAFRVDVSNEDEVKLLIEDTAARYGRLDYMFNNAGIAIGGDVLDLDMDQWEKVFNINLYGVVYGSTYAYRIMAQQGFGHIINTASVTGLMPQPGNTPYCASKHAVVGLSMSLRYEGIDLGVKVSVICPGHVQTDIYKNMKVANVPNDKVVASLPVKAMNTAEATAIILNGVVRNKDIIIFPSNVKWAWRIHRLFPRLLDKSWLDKIRRIRRLKLELEHHTDQ